jgi:hypothetical protein
MSLARQAASVISHQQSGVWKAAHIECLGKGNMQRITKIRKRRRLSTTYGTPAHRVALRLGGVYTLPNGKELIVGVGREGRYFLYHPLLWKISAWTISLPIEYEIDAQEGIVTTNGQPAPWRVEDLIDTGRTLDRT